MAKLTTFPSGPSVEELPLKVLLPGEHTGGGVGVGVGLSGARDAGFGFARGVAGSAPGLESVTLTCLASGETWRTAITGSTPCVTHNASKVIRAKVFLIVVLLYLILHSFPGPICQTLGLRPEY